MGAGMETSLDSARKQIRAFLGGLGASRPGAAARLLREPTVMAQLAETRAELAKCILGNA